MTDIELCLKIAQNLGISAKQVSATVELLVDGGTVPFIARYRKEATGSLDEVEIQAINNEYERLQELEKRRLFVLKTIEGQGKLDEFLEKRILGATTLLELEDLYLPFKPKKRTRATIARDKGLEPLALWVMEQNNQPLETKAKEFLDTEKEVLTTEDALNGASDILAEIISEDTGAREALRNLFKNTGRVKSTVIEGKEREGDKFADYFEWEEGMMACPSHRMLAMRRGEEERVLYLDFFIDDESAIEIIQKNFVKNNSESAKLLKKAIEDGFKRLLLPSIEVEMRMLTKKIADEKAIEVFAENLRELLLASALGQKAILAIDPGFKSGCKVVALNKEGKLLEETVIYPHEPQRMTEQARLVVLAFCAKHGTEAIAIGNGTASRETEQFIRSIKEIPSFIPVVMVNESGASIYSASEVAREEFPDHDLTVRGAVSIGRRLADPLAELVKLDPKSIGVGQYQHDVDQQALKRKLDEVVVSCVNGVGVELNTASKQLLSYVAGIGDTLAGNIVNYRNKFGAFKSRRELLKVDRMGPKVYEQCSGFLRIRDGLHPLDKSAVHPERYALVEQMAKDLKCNVDDLISKKDLREKIKLEKYVSENLGLPTLKDIMSELEKPGRDPRKNFEVFSFDENVHDIAHLKTGMRLPGIVTNVTNFGAFVDIGVHQDGLVHVSQISDAFVSDPSTVVKVGQQVWVTVTDCDVQRKRIALSMKGEANHAGSGNGEPGIGKGTGKGAAGVGNKAGVGGKNGAKNGNDNYDPNDFNSALAALKAKFK